MSSTLALISEPALKLDRCHRREILDYFRNAWQLEDVLLNSIAHPDFLYQNPDPLRNPLIFYLGHSAVFYINKLKRVGILQAPLHEAYENLFEVGVDPANAAELQSATAHIQWPSVDDVWEYRATAYDVITNVIETVSIDLPIRPEDPLWALMMAIEHQRIHIETSSMLLRQLPTDRLRRPSDWHYAPSFGPIADNPLIACDGGEVELGKPWHFPLYGWDNEYGAKLVTVAPFTVSQYMITNGEFQEFIADGGYQNRQYWDAASWHWRTEFGIHQPKFWIPTELNYRYRAMFDEIELPLDWPVEVNHYEAMAYCRWRGVRLLTEAEWQWLAYGNATEHLSCGDHNSHHYNLNLRFGSPTPVGYTERNQSQGTVQGTVKDIRGNVWEWLSDTFEPLSGFTPHYLYEDNSVPFFDGGHKMMLGGCWITNGTEALRFYRNWFRPSFYQHAGFRIAL